MFYISMNEEDIKAFTVAYMRRIGAYGKGNYVLMNRFKEWLKANNLYGPDTIIYAVALDDPSTTEAHRCRYDVCTPWSEKDAVPSGYVKTRAMDGGKYVTFLLHHTAEAIQTAWAECFGELAERGYLLDRSRPIMERYEKALIDDHRCEICIPVL